MAFTGENQSSVISVNSDLEKERRNATFYYEKLSPVLYGSQSKLRRKRYVQNLVLTDPFFKTCKPWAFCNREELYESALKKNVYIQKRIKELGLTGYDDQQYYRECASPREMNPFGLHFGAFVTTIAAQGTEEQKRKWIPPSVRYEIIGTYGQTELGHGSFIRGLETTATYDPKTQEFIIHSPKMTSMKWWPGNLGKTVNHCIIMAQLYTQGKCFGIHSFVVQLRSLKDHSTLPGVELGDIGPKMGYNGNDNGFLRFTNYRIPRENMLMRYSKVLEDGTYIAPKNTKLTYGSMVYLRTIIVLDSAKCLSMACTIAIRYSAVRRQTEVKPGGEELQILDYQTQQYKLLPLLATAYAMTFAGRNIKDIYQDISGEIEKGNLDALPQLHALSAGLKAFSSWVCVAGIEVCRMACGGHGYSHASGIPKIYSNIAPACTYEGENTVMMLQTARYLIKTFKQIGQGKSVPGFVSYLSNVQQSKSCMTEAVALKCLVMAYEHRAVRLIEETATKYNRLLQSGKAEEEARNLTSVLSVKAAKAHCHLYVLNTFVNVVADPEVHPNVREPLESLCKLYGVHGIIENLGEFIQDGFLSSEQVNFIHTKMLQLLTEVRRNAVAYVDAFDYPDRVLDSCLGRYDGQVYQALYEYAKSSPLNDTDVHQSYKTYLQPLIHGQTSEAKASARL